MADRLRGDWDVDSFDEDLEPMQFRCGFCGKEVASSDGWKASGTSYANIRICPNCNRPTFFDGEVQHPQPVIGDTISHLPKDIEKLYDDARSSAVASPTASVLALRKLLMNVAVNKGAKEGLSFQQYVDFLSENSYVPKDGKDWVDHIRTKGNDANHEIALMQPSDAEELITFADMLLKIIYEFPGRMKTRVKQPKREAYY